MLYVGTSGASPVVLVQKADGRIEVATTAEAGHSVYAIAQSPAGSQLAVGTRNRARGDRFGLVSIWGRRPDGALEPTPVLSCYQAASVTALDYATEDLLLSGGLDGRLSLWAPGRSRDRAVFEGQAHQGPVLGVCCISPGRAATMGADGFLRLWNLERLTCVWQHHTGRPAAGPGGLHSVWLEPGSGLLVSVHPCGTVVLTALRGEEPSPSVLALESGPVHAAAVESGCLIASDMNSLTLRSVALPSGRCLASAALDGPVVALVPYAPGRVLVVGRDGRATAWRTTPSLAPEGILAVADARCAAGPARGALAELARAETAGRRAARLARAQELVAAGRLGDLQSELDALAREGMSVEAHILLAEACMAQNRPLWALRARLSLARSLPDAGWCAVHFYTLADLLQSLDEPARAAEWFERAARCAPDYRDAAARAASLCRENAAPAIPPGTVRSGFASAAAVRAEVEKRMVLGDAWPWRTAIETGEMVLPSADVAVEPLLRRLTSQAAGELWRLERTVLEDSRGERREVEWIVHDGSTAGFPGLQAAFETRSDGQRGTLVRRTLVVPPAGTSPEEAALAIGALLECATGAGAQDWTRGVDRDAAQAAAYVGSQSGSARDFL